jgi:hypothetical protein
LINTWGGDDRLQRLHIGLPGLLFKESLLVFHLGLGLF